MNHPTDPMTPVRALLDAHAARSAAIRAGQPFAITEALRDKCFVAASFAVPALTALLSEHDAYCKHQKAAHAAYDEYKQRKYRNETPERIGWAYSEFQSQACKASLAIVEGK